MIDTLLVEEKPRLFSFITWSAITCIFFTVVHNLLTKQIAISNNCKSCIDFTDQLKVRLSALIICTWPVPTSFFLSSETLFE